MKKKQCSSCPHELPLSAFARDSSCPDGHQRTCRSCQRDYRLSQTNARMQADKEASRLQREEKRRFIQRMKHSNAMIQKMTLDQFLGLKLLRVYKSRDYVLVHTEEIRMSSLK